MADLFVASDLLEECRGLQEVIATAPPDEKRTAGNEVRAMIREEDIHYYGARKLEIRTLGAFALPDDLTLESQVFPVISYPGMRLRGELANVAFVSMQRLHTLAWMIVSPLVRTSEGDTALPPVEVDFDHDAIGQTQLEVDRPLTRPLYLPVGMIESVFVAA